MYTHLGGVPQVPPWLRAVKTPSWKDGLADVQNTVNTGHTPHGFKRGVSNRYLYSVYRTFEISLLMSSAN